MSHYEERLERDLTDIHNRVREVTERIATALNDCIRALLTHDRQMAARTILGDLWVNRAIRALDDTCHSFVARHLPSAGTLRFISSVLRLNIALERIGDYAVTVCRETCQLSKEPPAVVVRDIEMVADHARRMFDQSMKAFSESNAELARGTKAMSYQLGRTLDKVLADLVQEGEEQTRPIRDILALLETFHCLERVSDQARNICEETIFVATGETKTPKVYQVLFVDRHNAVASQMAEAIARKAFPESGRYASGGWEPASALSPSMREFMDAHGFPLLNAHPKPVAAHHDELAEYHVIVDLAGDARERLDELPFNTVLLEWDLEEVDGEDTSVEVLEDLHSRISYEVRDLMEALRGEGAC